MGEYTTIRVFKKDRRRLEKIGEVIHPEESFRTSDILTILLDHYEGRTAKVVTTEEPTS